MVDFSMHILLHADISITDFGQAELQFQKILEIDPYRVDDIDVYSNILYVTENHLQLSKLAHEFLAIDKDRPEVCCLVGKSFWIFSFILLFPTPVCSRQSLLVTC
jgi:hypothetical protein